MTRRRAVTREAYGIVRRGGAANRRRHYGHPLDDFARVALMVTGILRGKLQPGKVVTVRDVPLIMEAVKISREVNHPKRDNRVDGCGYWETAEMVDEAIRAGRPKDSLEALLWGVE